MYFKSIIIKFLLVAVYKRIRLSTTMSHGILNYSTIKEKNPQQPQVIYERRATKPFKIINF